MTHVSGFVSCHGQINQSFWGCSALLSPYKLMTYITDSTQQNIVFPTSSRVNGAHPYSKYTLPGYNHLSKSLILTPGSGKTYPVQKDQKFQIWYSEALFNYKVEDNFGIHCVHVFVDYRH